MRPRWYAFARRRGTEAVRPRTVICTRSALLAFHCERRECVRARDILNLGTAMGRSLTVRRMNERWHPPEQRPEPGAVEPLRSGRSGARKDAPRRLILPHPAVSRSPAPREPSHRRGGAAPVGRPPPAAGARRGARRGHGPRADRGRGPGGPSALLPWSHAVTARDPVRTRRPAAGPRPRGHRSPGEEARPLLAPGAR